VADKGRQDNIFVAAGGGRLADLGGVGVHFKVLGDTTGGAVAVVEHPIAPRVIVEPHMHRHEDELSYVIEGTVWARVGDRELEASAGSYVWKPRNVLHTFWNPGAAPARLLEIITPAGFERFFEELAALLEQPDETADAEVSELCDRYGLTFDHSWLPELESRFGPMRMV
jgi:quercetin dioxygenase-like cupin family protein